ncbi:MAG: hypothetical protein GXX90_06975, partial [Microbacteriaceae bacterium]|nr:hypothetical protein [Microbacteriaceae bacterium]
MAMVSARLLRLLSTALRDRPPGPFDVVPRGATALLVDIDPPDPPDPRPRAVAAAIAAHERLRAAEGAYAEALAGLDGIAAAEAAQWAGDSRYGDAHSGALRALAAEVAIPTAQNGRTLHQRIGEAGEWARRLPALWAEHCAGALTAAHLRAADRASAHLDGLAADGEPLRDAFERRLLAESVEAAAGGRGTRRTPREFGKLAARIVAEVSPVSVAEGLDRAMAERCVHVQPVAPGMSGLTV